MGSWSLRLAGAVLTLGIWGTAAAQPSSHTWCIDTDLAASSFCQNLTEANYKNSVRYEGLEEAWSAAEQAPDAPGGIRPEHTFCIAGPHTETLPTLSLDLMGEQTRIQVDEGTAAGLICADPTAPVGHPLFAFTPTQPGSRSVSLSASYRAAACGGGPWRLATAENARLDIQANVQGGSGPLISVASPHSNDRIELVNSLLAGVEGPVVVSNQPLGAQFTEISGSVVEGGEPLIDVGADGELSGMYRVVLFGNVAAGPSPSPLVRVRAGRFEFTESALAANTNLSGGDLIELVAAPTGSTAEVTIRRSTFSRNALRTSGLPPAPSLPQFGATGGDSGCVLPVSAGAPYMARSLSRQVDPPSPAAPAAIIRAAPPETATGNLYLRLMESWFVQNEVAPGGAVVELGGTDAGEQFLALWHNTFEVGPEATIGLSQAGPTGSLLSARNLFVGAEPPHAALHPDWTRYAVTLDVVEGGASTWFSAFPAGTQSILGPI